MLDAATCVGSRVEAEGNVYSTSETSQFVFVLANHFWQRCTAEAELWMQNTTVTAL